MPSWLSCQLRSWLIFAVVSAEAGMAAQNLCNPPMVAGVDPNQRAEHFLIHPSNKIIQNIGALSVEDDDSVVDLLVGQDGVGFQIFKLRPCPATFGASDEIRIVFGEAIGRARENCPDRLRRVGIFLSRRRPMPGERFAALARMWWLRHAGSTICRHARVLRIARRTSVSNSGSL